MISGLGPVFAMLELTLMGSSQKVDDVVEPWMIFVTFYNEVSMARQLEFTFIVH
jgi:hypothetical protein